MTQKTVDDRPEKTEGGEPVVATEPGLVAEESKPQAEEPSGESKPQAEEPSEEPTVEEFDSHISNCQRDLDDIDLQIEELRRQRTRVERERDELVEHKRRLFPPPSQAKAMRDYLDQQHRNRAERAERLGLLIQAGLISGKAPIDAVRARSAGHGNRVISYPTQSPSHEE